MASSRRRGRGGGGAVAAVAPPAGAAAAVVDAEEEAARDAALHAAMTVRKGRRCAIMRREARREYRRARRKQREAAAAAGGGSSSSSSSDYAGSSSDGGESGAASSTDWSSTALDGQFNVAAARKAAALAKRKGADGGWGRDIPSIVLATVTLAPKAEHFLSAPAHEEVWERDRDAAYHMERLTADGNPLGERVPVWEPLEEQPDALDAVEASPSMEGAWVKRNAGTAAADDLVRQAEANKLIPHGDPQAFRDVELWADRMDAFAGLETTYKLCSAKPAPVDADHADCIVLYQSGLGDGTCNRVVGAVIYDASGNARVDMNFQHHMVEDGRYRIKSGHWHILEPGSHTHASGFENHFPFQTCPWIWLAIPKTFGVIPTVPVGQ